MDSVKRSRRIGGRDADDAWKAAVKHNADPPAASLLGMPCEILTGIVRRLDVFALVRMGGVCRWFRRVATVEYERDPLWNLRMGLASEFGRAMRPSNVSLRVRSRADVIGEGPSCLWSHPPWSATTVSTTHVHADVGTRFCEIMVDAVQRVEARGCSAPAAWSHQRGTSSGSTNALQLACLAVHPLEVVTASGVAHRGGTCDIHWQIVGNRVVRTGRGWSREYAAVLQMYRDTDGLQIVRELEPDDRLRIGTCERPLAWNYTWFTMSSRTSDGEAFRSVRLAHRGPNDATHRQVWHLTCTRAVNFKAWANRVVQYYGDFLQSMERGMPTENGVTTSHLATLTCHRSEASRMFSAVLREHLNGLDFDAVYGDLDEIPLLYSVSIEPSQEHARVPQVVWPIEASPMKPSSS